MLVSPNQDSSAGLTTPELQGHSADAHGATSRAEQVARRVGFITEALNALESELHGDSSALDSFENKYEQLPNDLKASSNTATNSTGTSAILTCDSLDELLSRFENDIPAGVLRETTSGLSSSKLDGLYRDVQLDDVLADVEPLTDRADAAIHKHSDVTAHMAQQLARLVAVSQGLAHHAATLDAQAQDLSSQRNELERASEELSLERERLSHERFELSLRREAIDAETVDLQRMYGSLSERLSALQSGHGEDNADDQDLSFDSASETPGCSGSDGAFSNMTDLGDDSESTIERPLPPQLVSEYVWSGEKTACEQPDAHGQAARTLDEVCAQQLEAEQLQAERQKLREFVEAFDAADADHEAESVAVPAGSAMLLGENNTQNARRSRDEAIRQLDELLSSYASVDTSRSASAPMSESVSQTIISPVAGSPSASEPGTPADEATFDFDTGDSLFGRVEPQFDCDLTADEPTAIIPRLSGGASDSELEYDERVNYEADEDPTADAIETLPEFPCVEVVPVPPTDDASMCAMISDTVEHISQVDVSVERPIEGFSTSFAVVDEFEEQVESSSAAGSLFQKVEASAAPVIDEPAKAEVSSAAAAPTGETDKVANLRSQLAEMFGIDSLKDETSSAAPTSHSGSSGSLFSSRHAVDEGDSAANDQQSPSSSAELATGSLLREVLKSETAAPAPVAPVSAPARTEEPAASDGDDPIKAYMAQLLARNRQQSGKTDPVAVQAPPFGRTPSATAAAATSVTSDASVDDASVEGASEAPRATVNDLSWLSESPKHKQDKESVRAHMKTLREVANQSARTAVVRSNKRQLKMQVLTKTVAAVMSLIFGATSLILELPVIYGYSVIALGLIFAIDLLIVIVRDSIKKSKGAKKRPQSGDDHPVEVKPDPRTEGRLANFTRAEQSAK